MHSTTRILRRYDYRRQLRLEIWADWAQASYPVWYRWSTRSADGVWVPIADWDTSGYQVADFCHSPHAALARLWKERWI